MYVETRQNQINFKTSNEITKNIQIKHYNDLEQREYMVQVTGTHCKFT